MPKKQTSPTTSSVNRQPTVAILGHVDHGKTTLLDYIRSTHRQEKEAGGITQSIGAYEAEYKGQKLTFVDTPGHAAFSKMRSRGANIADIAVLVIAAEDGVKPQTLESIKHIKDAGIPYIVAITKIDKPGNTPDLAKAELTQAEVFVEGYGGNTPAVALSGKTGKGVDELLENILLLSELEELPYDDKGELVAPIIEAQKDMKKGVTVSVIVKQGILRVGEEVGTSSASGKIRAIFDDSGRSIKEVLPGKPALILGFKDLPLVGEVVSPGLSHDTVEVNTSENEDKSEELELEEAPVGRLNVIIRADTLGSLEAIKNSLSPEVNIILSGTGDISESDVLLAISTGSIILGFAVRANNSVLKLAELDNIVVKKYKIIYELLEYLEKKVLRILEPTIDEEELGSATVLKVFEINKELVAGCHVDSGRLEQGDIVHVKKVEGSTKEAKIKSIRVGKDEVKKVEAGKECGVLLFPNLDIDKKDVIIPYKKLKTDED